MKLLKPLCLFFATLPAFAGNVPGDVNFGLDISPDNHSYKFRLVINDGPITFPTGCESPATGLSQALSNGAIGVSTARLTVQASDCTLAQDQWETLSGYLDYDNQYWYNLYVNMSNKSFHS